MIYKLTFQALLVVNNAIKRLNSTWNSLLTSRSGRSKLLRIYLCPFEEEHERKATTGRPLHKNP